MKKGDDIEDLMGLIELAEKTTDRLDKLRDQIFRLVSFVFFAIGLFFIFYFSFRQYLFEALGVTYFGFEIAVGFFISIFILPFVWKIIKISKNIQSELGITDKLYNLIDPLRASLEDEMSIMKTAAIEMRLRRIHFGGSNKNRKYSKSKIKSKATSKIQKELSLET